MRTSPLGHRRPSRRKLSWATLLTRVPDVWRHTPDILNRPASSLMHTASQHGSVRANGKQEGFADLAARHANPVPCFAIGHHLQAARKDAKDIVRGANTRAYLLAADLRSLRARDVRVIGGSVEIEKSSCLKELDTQRQRTTQRSALPADFREIPVFGCRARFHIATNKQMTRS